MACNKLKQIKSITVAGGQQPIKANECKFTPSGKEREHHVGQRPKDGGFTETPTGAKLEMVLNDRMETDYYALNEIECETIIIEYTGGGTHVMPNAWCEKPGDLDTGTGKWVFCSNESRGG